LGGSDDAEAERGDHASAPSGDPTLGPKLGHRVEGAGVSVGIFISHSSANTQDALELDHALRHPRGLAEGVVPVETWLDKWDIGLGRYYAPEIVAGQRRSHAAIFLLTDEALASSEVVSEWEMAKEYGLTRFVFMPDREAQLARLPDAWRYHLKGKNEHHIAGKNELRTIQAWQWEGAERAAADVYLALGLPSPQCPCGKPLAYNQCHARRHAARVPARVTFAEVARRRIGGEGLPLGVGEDSSLLTFDPEVDRHLYCIGSMGSGKSNLISVVSRAASHRWPHYERFLISAQRDPRILDAEVTDAARRPSEMPRVVTGVVAAVDAGRPCLLMVDDLHTFSERHWERLADIPSDGPLHVVCTHALEYGLPPTSPLWAFLQAARMRVQLQAGAMEFGREVHAGSPAGRATIWSSAWDGPREAQIALRSDGHD